MKLTRKEGATTLKTRDGIEHPNAVIELNNISADLLNHIITFSFAYFHDDTCRTNGYQPIEEYMYIRFSFNDNSTPSFNTVINLFDFSDGVVMNETTVKAWVLNQTEEITNQLFSVNWE